LSAYICTLGMWAFVLGDNQLPPLISTPPTLAHYIMTTVVFLTLDGAT
jgi:hypothetical protein